MIFLPNIQLKFYQVLSQWTAYGSCSVTCGLGEKARERTCDLGDCSQVDVTLSETASCDEGDCMYRQISNALF